MVVKLLYLNFKVFGLVNIVKVHVKCQHILLLIIMQNYWNNINKNLKK